MYTKVSPASTTTTTTATTTIFTMHDSNNTWKQEYDPILQQYYYVNLLDNSISFDSPCEVINHKKSTTSTNTSISKSFFMPFKRSSSYTSEKDSKKQCKFTINKSTATTATSTSTSTTDNKKGSNYSLYRCLSSALSLKKTKSNESTNSSTTNTNSQSMSSDTLNESTTIITPMATPSASMTTDISEIIDQNTLLDVDAHIDDDYLLNNNKLNNFKNFAGTNHMRRNSNDSYDSEEPESESEDGYEEDIQIFDYNYIYNPQDNYRNPRIGGFYNFDYEEEQEEDDDIERENERRELRLQMLKELY